MTEPVAAACADTIIAYFDLELARRIVNCHLRLARACMLQRVGQAFLSDSIGGEIDRPW